MTSGSRSILRGASLRARGGGGLARRSALAKAELGSNLGVPTTVTRLEARTDAGLWLRALAEGLAKKLDAVLDGILRSLSSRRKPGSIAIPITVVRGNRASAAPDCFTGALASAGDHGGRAAQKVDQSPLGK